MKTMRICFEIIVTDDTTDREIIEYHTVESVIRYRIDKI